jgi:organic radical activating enzyme
MSDWSLKPLKEIQVGDMVMSTTLSDPTFPSKYKASATDYSASYHGGKSGINGQLKPSRVTHTHSNGIKPVSRMTANGHSLVGTDDHRVLITTHRPYWQRLESTSGHQTKSIRVEETNSLQFRNGWLAGYLQGDGCFHEFSPSSRKNKYMRLKVASRDIELLHETLTILEEKNLSARWITHMGGPRTFPSKHGKDIDAIELTRDKEARTLYDEIMIDPRANYDYARGWLSGFYDAEGTLNAQDNSPRISQAKPDTKKRLEEVLSFLGLRYSVHTRDNDFGNHPISSFAISNSADFFAMCRPVLSRKIPESLSYKQMRTVFVNSVEKLDLEIPVYDITTEAGNYIAEGFVVHNCDTIWDDDNDQYLSVDEIIAAVEAVRLPSCNLIVITGGEPLRQDMSMLVPTLLSIHPNLCIQFETAGILWQNALLQPRISIVVSPKTPRINDLISLHAAAFKYVIKSGENSEVDGLPLQSTQIPGQYAELARPRRYKPVYLSPCDEGDLERNQANQDEVVRLAMKHGYIAGLQMHKIWNVR